MTSEMCKFLLPIAALILPITAAAAAPTADPAGDFLPSYAGVQGADLDVLSVNVQRNNSQFTLGATMAGAIGQTAAALYVWGIDRGAGTARFVGGTPSVGAGVLFDSVLVLRPNGTGSFVDLINAANNFALAPGAITISGSSITGLISIAALPSQGFAAADYTFNLWPRSGAIAGNTGIADFAPDASNVNSSFVPEPASWALLVAGFGLVGAVQRRRERLRSA